jgi:hypothetical protein
MDKKTLVRVEPGRTIEDGWQSVLATAMDETPGGRSAVQGRFRGAGNGKKGCRR